MATSPGKLKEKTPDTNVSEFTTKTPDIYSIQRNIIGALARIRATSDDEIQSEVINNGGDLELDSLEGIAVIGALEKEFGRKLPGPKDLEREQFTSISALVSLVERKL